jgi:hypothetical protein
MNEIWGMKKPPGSSALSGGLYPLKWRPVRESNPSCQDENLES